MTVQREQAVAVIARWIASEESVDLGTFYTAEEIDAFLDPFNDGAMVAASLREEMAFAIDRGIVLGTVEGDLNPKDSLLRIQGAAMLIRADILTTPFATIAPLEATNVVGETHVVDVTLRDGLVPDDYYFVWDVEGVTTTFGDFPGVDLEGVGEVQFSYAGDVAGADQIHLWIYEGDSAEGTEVFHGIVDKTWEEEAAFATIVPLEATNVVGETHVVDVTLRDGLVPDDYYFVWDVEGVTTTFGDFPGVDLEGVGEVQFSYAGDVAGADQIHLWIYEGDSAEGTEVFHGIVDKTWEEEAAFATIVPLEATNVVGETHVVDVTLRDGLVPDDYYFVWDVEGVTTTFGDFPGVDLEGVGEVQFSYAGDVAGADQIHLWIYEGDSAEGTEVFHGIVDKTWEEEAAFATIAPLEATNFVGETHVVDVTLRDGLLVDDHYFVWDVEGVTTTYGDFPGIDLEGVGEVQFSYTGDTAGDDQIHLWIYEGDSAAGTEVFHVIVNKTWVDFTVAVTPLTATNAVGTNHVVDVDAASLVAGADVNDFWFSWDISGNNVLTDAGVGLTQLDYTDTAGAGTDVITLEVYTLNSGGDGPGELVATAAAVEKIWETPGASEAGEVRVEDVVLTSEGPNEFAAGVARSVFSEVLDQFGQPLAEYDLAAFNPTLQWWLGASTAGSPDGGIQLVGADAVTSVLGELEWGAQGTWDAFASTTDGDMISFRIYLDLDDDGQVDAGELLWGPYTVSFVANGI